MSKRSFFFSLSVLFLLVSFSFISVGPAASKRIGNSAMFLPAIIGSAPDVTPSTLSTKIDEFLRRLDQIEKDIGSIADEPPASISIVPPTAPTSGIVSFGKTDTFTPVDRTVTLSFSAGKSATFVSLSGLIAPFDFKGGTFPGTGGTCGSSLANGCTIVVTFSPKNQPGAVEAEEFTLTGRTVSLEYSADILLEYKDRAGTRRSSPLTLIGQVTPAGVLTVYPSNTIPPLSTDILDRNVYTYVQLYATNPVKINAFRDPDPPFSLRTETCGGLIDAVNLVRCNIKVTYRPAAIGVSNSTIGVSYDDGISVKQLVSPLRGEATTVGEDAKNISPSRDLLVVYNTRSPESTTIKEYYLSNRPGIGDANVLAVTYPPENCGTSCADPNSEVVPKADVVSFFKTPIASWLAAHPEKHIRYLILLPGIPSRFAYPSSQSVQDFLAKEFALRPTFIDMGSVAATKAYIDKLRTMSGRMSSPSVVISATKAGAAGNSYYLEDQGNNAGMERGPAFDRAQSLIRSEPNVKIFFHGYNTSYIFEGRDVLGFFTWGFNGGRGGDYANDGVLRFSGNSGWYVIQTAESFNGRREIFQGNYIDWWSANAFGGTNYAYTPVGAVTHVEEPGVAGINSPDYFVCWDEGRLFIDCAWQSAVTPYLTVRGDPFVAK